MTAPRELVRLIARYRFLQGELASEALSRSPSGTVAASTLDDVFLQIVRYQAEEPAVSYRQIEFLLAILAEGPPDAELRRMISTEALAHIRRLADRLAPDCGAGRIKSRPAARVE